MKDMARLEECSGRSHEEDTAEKKIMPVVHMLLTVLILNSHFTKIIKKTTTFFSHSVSVMFSHANRLSKT